MGSGGSVPNKPLTNLGLFLQFFSKDRPNRVLCVLGVSDPVVFLSQEHIPLVFSMSSAVLPGFGGGSS